MSSNASLVQLATATSYETSSSCFFCCQKWLLGQTTFWCIHAAATSLCCLADLHLLCFLSPSLSTGLHARHLDQMCLVNFKSFCIKCSQCIWQEASHLLPVCAGVQWYPSLPRKCYLLPNPAPAVLRKCHPFPSSVPAVLRMCCLLTPSRLSFAQHVPPAMFVISPLSTKDEPRTDPSPSSAEEGNDRGSLAVAGNSNRPSTCRYPQ